MSLFDEPERLEGTSLRAAHRGRVDILDIEDDGNRLTAFRFIILRHPRPYAFSSQHHRVMERYRYDVVEERLSRDGSVNLSRLAGKDGEPAGHGGL